MNFVGPSGHHVVQRGHADLAAAHQGRPVIGVGGVLARHLDAHLDVHSRVQREPGESPLGAFAGDGKNDMRIDGRDAGIDDFKFPVGILRLQ